MTFGLDRIILKLPKRPGTTGQKPEGTPKMARNENAMQAVRNGYHVAPKPSFTRHGFKVWTPEMSAEWKRTKINNATDVEAWRNRLAR